LIFSIIFDHCLIQRGTLKPLWSNIGHFEAKHAYLETNLDSAAGSATLPRLGGIIGQQGSAPRVYVEAALRALVHVAPRVGSLLADVATPSGAHGQAGEGEQVLLRVLVEGDGPREREQARLVDVEIALAVVTAEADAGHCTFARDAGIGRRLGILVPC
jgi:hypothetical protein